ncbi:cupin domain-containing protein [Arthrobacter sp. PAMC25564]|uniref:cupin domain-containing protein n=1 Tax=Arthrobacter sp. PAMC25564 TaxID=2565366 RepID=UPI001F113A1E|nr:cupin domain-containing protein [Arthrobacter sp. PAMC25564]
MSGSLAAAGGGAGLKSVLTILHKGDHHGFDHPQEPGQSGGNPPVNDGMGQVELVNLDAGAVARATFLPGWKWSQHVKPMVQTDSCMVAHKGYTVSGRLKVVMDDGEESEFGPGGFGVIPPGHDPWVVGDEPYVFIDWRGMEDYAKPKE